MCTEMTKLRRIWRLLTWGSFDIVDPTQVMQTILVQELARGDSLKYQKCTKVTAEHGGGGVQDISECYLAARIRYQNFNPTSHFLRNKSITRLKPAKGKVQVCRPLSALVSNGSCLQAILILLYLRAEVIGLQIVSDQISQPVPRSRRLPADSSVKLMTMITCVFCNPSCLYIITSSHLRYSMGLNDLAQYIPHDQPSLWPERLNHTQIGLCSLCSQLLSSDSCALLIQYSLEL